MICALSNQIKYANSTVTKYGNDNSGIIEYKFNNNGFRNSTDFLKNPDIIFAGGSISFGIGLSNDDCYKTIVSTTLNKSYWDLSYAGEYYDNNMIYTTVLAMHKIVGDVPVVIQWVSDLRSDSISKKIYSYIDQLNTLFSKCIHIFIDGRESKQSLDLRYFGLANPIWIDTAACGTHPGKKTHQGIAKMILRELHD